MRVIQEFTQLPSGEQVLKSDDMIVQLKLASFLQKFQVKRVTEYSDFCFDPIPDKTFKFKGDQQTDVNARIRPEEFWAEHRSEALTQSEDKMDVLVRQLERVKGFKAVLFVAKAFIETSLRRVSTPSILRRSTSVPSTP